MKYNKLSKYLIITFAITYFCWGSLAALIQTGIITFSHPIATVLHLIGGFGPPIAAFFVLDVKPSLKAVWTALFMHKKKTSKFLWTFFVLEVLVIAVSSMELNPSVSLYLVPVIFLQAVFIYGGNEELGWRGFMQPYLEKKLSFPLATIITGSIWGIWHIPLWFVDGASQQNIPFLSFFLLGILLSFFFAAVYKKTQSVFYCNVMHGLTNTLLSLFVIKINMLLIVGLVIMLGYSFYLWYSKDN